MKTAIITGIYGQDGTLLAEYLNEKNYKVVGLVSKERATKSKLDFAEIIVIQCQELFNFSPKLIYSSDEKKNTAPLIYKIDKRY